MTTFPWNITRAQRMAFEAIATGDTNPRASSETITALVDAGLIERCADRLVGRDAGGNIYVPNGGGE